MHPVLLDLGSIRIGNAVVPIQIGSYGAFFVLALVVGYLVPARMGKRYDAKADWAGFMWTSYVIGFVGAKLLNLLVFLPAIIRHEVSWIGVAMGGGVWFGGVIPAYLYCWWYCSRHNLPFGTVANFLGVAIPAAHAFGRIGCFLGGCCYGAATTSWLSVTYHSELAHALMKTPLDTPLHPTQLYEAAAEWMNAGVGFWLWKRGVPQWFLTGLWMTLYGVERFFIEFLRNDLRGGLGPFSTSQWIAILLVALGIPLMIWARRRNVPEWPVVPAKAVGAKKR